MIKSANNNSGKKYWRSLGELQDTPEFRDFLHREFPVAASEFPEGVSRRRWMQLMGASLALGGLAGCRWETEKIAPFAVRPENRIPGKAERFATSIDIGGMPRHLVVTSYDGRPIKVEGNPDHPDSRGATDAFAQATILDLYDPDRSDTLRQRQGRGEFTRSWDDFDAFIANRIEDKRPTLGAGLAFLIEPTRSLSEQMLLAKVQTRFPKAKFFRYSALMSDNEEIAAERVFGKRLLTSLNLAKAKRIVCLDADPLGLHPTAVRNIGGYSSGRDPDKSMNRLYAVESQHTATGAAADHRLAIKSHDMGAFLQYVARLINAQLNGTQREGVLTGLSERAERFAKAIVDDLVKHRGEGIIVVGAHQPVEVHELAMRLNSELNNIGKTLDLYTELNKVEFGSLTDLIKQANTGKLDTLFVLGGNPVYDTPGDVDFANLLSQIKTTVRCGLYDDETSDACTWHVPLTHPFESWGDVTSGDGIISVCQPLIEPLLNGRSRIELLSKLAGDRREPQAIVRATVASAVGGLGLDGWNQVVHDGQSRIAIQKPYVPAEEVGLPANWLSESEAASNDLIELVFTASSNTLDGRFANNGWMQETPDFLTKLTWDNAAIVSPKTAQKIGAEHGKLLQIDVEGRSLQMPVYVLPGQAEGSIALPMGYGRSKCGMIGGHQQNGIDSVGVNVAPLRSTANPFITLATQVTPIDRAYEFATTQDHHAIDTVGMEEIGRRVNDLVREGPLDAYLEHPDFAQHIGHHVESDPLWTEPTYEGHAWGMSIDLNKCIGCNACTVACQSENNVPIVGKEQVALGREMHWLRIDRYFKGDIDDPEVTHQPVACHHCENAPCEQVCPVAATVHSDEGLNDMVYNRCIGTRYCANNCPYKVRRFNFFDYNEPLEEPGRELVQLAVNPEVTVRNRGVMEKCTYCVQRIQSVKIDAKTGQRSIQDGEIKTACQQACPAQAIEFGDLNDPDSRVAQAHKNSRAYGMLSELNVKPRTRYLARIRNPHPLLATTDTHAEGHHGKAHSNANANGDSHGHS